MKQAIHIFKKDLGYFRYEIAVSLLAALAFSVIGMRNTRGLGPIAFILPATWWFLIGRVVHAEALPGNQQFWLTRPYDWRSLLGAKLIFVFAFVNFPLLFADAAIIHSAGFSMGKEVTGLLWTQVLLIGAFVLPAAAFSSLTSGLAELLVVTLFLIVAALARLVAAPMISWGVYWGPLEWVKTSWLIVQIAMMAAIILLWQYARRKTFAARMTAGVAAVALFFSGGLIPWAAAFSLQAHLSPRPAALSTVRIELDSERKWLGRIYASEQDQIVAELPLQITGLPDGTELRPDGLAVELRDSNGETRRVKYPPPSNVDFEGGITSLRAFMDRAFYLRVKDRPLQIRGKLYFTLYRNKAHTSIPLDGRPVAVDGVGRCSAGSSFLLCNSAFRPQSDLVAIRVLQNSANGIKALTENPSYGASYSPFPADVNIDPLFRFFSPRMKTIVEASVSTLEPLMHAERDFEIDSVRLGAFARILP